MRCIGWLAELAGADAGPASRRAATRVPPVAPPHDGGYLRPLEGHFVSHVLVAISRRCLDGPRASRRPRVETGGTGGAAHSFGMIYESQCRRAAWRGPEP